MNGGEIVLCNKKVLLFSSIPLSLPPPCSLPPSLPLQAIRGQAIKILGSVDFLGNPVGLVSDVASGVAGVLDSQDVIGLVRDVTHGMSDTTSKVGGACVGLITKVL